MTNLNDSEATMLCQCRHAAGEIANRRGIIPCRPCNGSGFAEIDETKSENTTDLKSVSAEYSWGVFNGGMGGFVGLIFNLAILLALLVACRTEREELQSVSLVVTNGSVVDGTGTDPIADGLVAIQGNRIAAVGQATDFKIPEEAIIIDAAGGTILPGVIKAHV